jgi:hypothetical protein
MEKKIFPYAPWTKGFGLLIVLIGIISFFSRHRKTGVFDYNEIAIGVCFGFLFIFFSREKTDDEMIHYLKFKALTRAIIMTFFLTHLYNYIFLNWHFKRESDRILSISAYQFLAITLIIATGIFYFQKKQALLKGEE